MSPPTIVRYLAPSQSAGRLFVRRGTEGPVVMLNLLRFRDVADYSANPELAPAARVSGAEAFDCYIRHTLPFLRQSGGHVEFLGVGGPFLIGPEDERWDMAMRVSQGSCLISRIREPRRLSRRPWPPHGRARGFSSPSPDGTSAAGLIWRWP